MTAPALEVWHVDFDLSERALLDEERKRPRLSAADRARVAVLRDATAQRERRLTAIALRLALVRSLGDARCDGVPFARNETGRPYLDNQPISFNVSHAGGHALVAVMNARDMPLGVDLEMQRDLKMSAERRARVLAAGQLLAATTATGRDFDARHSSEADRVLQAWVRIEAVAKASGLGLARVLTRFGIIGAPADTETTAHGTDATASSIAALSVRDLDIRCATGQPVFAAIALAHQGMPDEVAVAEFPHDAAALGDWLRIGRG